MNRPRMLALGPVDRVLMDMVMPVLGLTANVNPLDLQEFRKAGLNEVLLKPFEPAELCHRVEHLLLVKGCAA